MELSKIDDWYQKRVNEMLRDTERRANEAGAAIRTRFMAEWERRVREIFKETVDAFYDDYNPYLYSRRGRLYRLLFIEDVGSTSKTMGFHPEEIPFRDGYAGEDGLYDQTFRKGWHGGAASGLGHPDPGTPYWRVPATVRGSKGQEFDYEHWPRWGNPAYISEEAPLDMWNRKMDDFEAGEMVTMYNDIAREELAARGLHVDS